MVLVVSSSGELCVVRAANHNNFNESVKKSEREPATPLETKRIDVLFSGASAYFPEENVWHDQQSGKKANKRKMSKISYKRKNSVVDC